MQKNAKTAAKKTTVKKPVAKTTKAKVTQTKALVKVEQQVISVGDFLTERDELIAKFLAGGKKSIEVCQILNLPEDELDKLKQNPIFVKYFNDRVLSRGLANMTERLASEKRVADALDNEIAKRLSDPDNNELEKQSLANILRMRNESFDRIRVLMGEDDSSKRQSTMVLIMDRVRENSKLASKEPKDLENFKPSDEYPIIDVMSEEI